MDTNKIIDYRDLIAKSTQGFIGRQWVREAVDGFLGSAEHRYFLLSGEPGVGKTALLAFLVAERGYVHHFVGNDLSWLSPTAFAQSVGAQLATRFGAWVLAEDDVPLEQLAVVHQEVGEIAAGGTAIGVQVLIQQYVGLPVEELARKLILRSLQRLDARQAEPIVLVIDAVDEATTYSGKPTIYDLVAGLGAAANVRVILSAHPGVALQDLDFKLRGGGLVGFALDGANPHNLEDCRGYLQQAVDGPAMRDALQQAGLSPDEFIDLAVACSEGSFLYLTSLLDAVHAGQEGLDLKALPAGLAGHYVEQLRRIKEKAGTDWRSAYRPAMGVLAVARSPLTARQLSAYTGADREMLDEVLEAIRLFLDQISPPDGLPAYRWYHSAFAGFLTSEHANANDWFDPQRYHGLVADRIHAAHPEPGAIDDEYAMRYLAYHDHSAGPDHFPQLYALISPALRDVLRGRFGSDAEFRHNLAEAVEAALEDEPARGLPQLVRCGLVDATIGSMVASVPVQVLTALAQTGQWERALTLAHLSATRRGLGLRAIVEGLLVDATPENVELARQLALQIPSQGDDARDRALALAGVASWLARRGDQRAPALFEDSQSSAEATPDADERARTLAQIARLRWPSDAGSARQGFDAALALARAMPDEATAEIRDSAAAANMVAQTAVEARWVIDHTPIDARGAKARALADVAAAMAEAGDTRAGDIFDEAQALAGQIGNEGIWSEYREHSIQYIASRRVPAAESPPPMPDRTELEAQLRAAERVPPDTRGFYPIALLGLARALLAGHDADRGRRAVEQAIAAADEAEGGYQAQVLAIASTLMSELGDEARATELADRAAEKARDDADLLISYRAWLVKRGYEWAASLREVAATRASFRKSRYESDKVLSQAAQSLAAENAATASDLAGQIEDPIQRARALAAVAGNLAAAGATGADDLLEEIEDIARGQANDNDRSYLLASAADIMAPLYPAGALRLSAAISVVGFKVATLAGIGDALAARNLPADQVRDEAWQVAHEQLPGQGTLALAQGLAHVGKQWAVAGDARATDAFDLAQEVARTEPGAVERVEALIRLAVAMSPSHRDKAQEVLLEAEQAVSRIDDRRGRGRSLSRIAGAWMDLDTGKACRLLAELRWQGRSDFLDGVAQIAQGVGRLGGPALVSAVFEALEEAQEFFAD